MSALSARSCVAVTMMSATIFPEPAAKVQPFVAAGAAAHMMNAGAQGIDVSDTKFGFQTGAGLKIGVSQSASILGSGWYHIVEDANHWSVRGGLAFNI